LSAKVMHHDEGVNGVFVSTLFHQGGYKYNPENFHGPSLYYAALLTTSINSFFYGREGLSTFAVRLVPAIFGIGVVWLLLCLRRQLGTFGALSAAAIAVVSPGMVFFSRYFIHEIMFVFFTLGIIVAWLRYRETAQPRYFILASAAAALLCATKETWIITAAVLLLAIPCAVVYLGLRGNPVEADYADKKNRREPLARQAVESSPAWSQRRLYLTAALVFVAVWVLLYSSFFMNFPKGVADSVRTFGTWFHTGQQKDHMHPWFTYFRWIWQEDGPILVLGAAGVIVALVRATNRFAVFTAFWTMGIFTAYSLVPYKTPWLVLSILLPLSIMAGYALGQCTRGWLRAAAVVALAGSCGWSAYQAIDLSFFTYDDDTHPYVYAHTKREFLGLVDDVESIAAHTREGKQIGITIMAPEHWPLPWYLRNYPNAGYWGQVVTNNVQPIIIAYDTQTADVNRLLGDKYRIISSHYLRGNKLVLYLRNDLQP
jgi:uncharacterized protein (TIGR03663 family)